MPKFTISYARIEHQVYRFNVEADSEHLAKKKADEHVESDDFDWDTYDVVHAEEFILQVDKQPSLSRVSL